LRGEKVAKPDEGGNLRELHPMPSGDRPLIRPSATFSHQKADGQKALDLKERRN
jgi:hypothetical protein